MSSRGQLLPGVIGHSPAMREVDRVTRKVAVSNASVLILGETGTGKELIASAVHRLSHRSGGPFVKVNCGALSESLLESELFGHVRGAFTGAVANRAGRFEAADGGSIFLDEINSTTLTLQVKLLRVLQEKEFERVGDTSSHRTDARIIAASNRDLMRQVQLEEFREDLYWRLNVVPIDLPALRHRREDIPALVAFFLDHYNEVNDRYVSHLGSGVMRALQDYHWPGNVRELQNYVERAVVMSDTDELVLDALPLCVRDPHHSAPVREMAGPAGGLKSVPAGNGFVEPHQSEAAPGAPVGSAALDINRMDLKTLARIVVQRGLDEADDAEDLHSVVVDQVERELISQLLLRCGGVQTKTASRLGMNRNTLSKKMKDYGLNLDD
ncbi:sigma-54-dependent Fis family transcriptional regulator [Rhodopirellula bahusiensis]|uniref:Sigma-54-dependent Fis family transcriptional regulator n=2 Tax=Rhodopirellula bahusiensis TaxID=2014065 RepID=A0A2G1W442_9BACT|nr:sigma-54 dependent transcriptional regulator [Rhodopirellula bahusiensis]PHQ33620.1 sigma-54-dependent Fis family transcriptional regulator [Rhodopirellula bahusiensis]